MSSIMKGLVNEKLPGKEDDIFRDRINDFDPEDLDGEEVDEGFVDNAIVGAAKYAVPAITRSLPTIAKAGAKVGAKLGTRAGVGVAKKLGTSAMSAGRLGKKLGTVVGQYAAPAAAVSAANRLAAAAANRNQGNSAQQDVEQIDEAIQWTKPKNDEHDEVYIQLDAVERGEEYPEHVHAMLKHLANRSNFQGAMKKAKPMTITHKDLQPGGKYAEMSNTEANESEPNISDLNQTKVRRVKKIFNNAMKHGTPMERPIVLYDTHTGHTHLLAGNTRLTYNTHYGSGSTVVHAIKYDSSKMNEEVDQVKQRGIKQQMLVSSILTRVQGFLHDNKRSVDPKQFITDLQKKLDTLKSSGLKEEVEQTAPVAETSIDQNPRSFIIYDKSSKKILQIDVMPSDLPLAVQYAQNAGYDAGYIRQKPSHFKGEHLDEQSNDKNQKLRDALEKVKNDFTKSHADGKPTDKKPTPAPEPEPTSVGGGTDYYPKAPYGRRDMGDSVEYNGKKIDELDDSTYISYRAKAKNELNKSIKDLNARGSSQDVDTRTMKKRADGIKLAHKRLALAEGTMTHGIFDSNPRKATMALQGLKSVMSNALPASQAADILHRYLFDDELFDLIDNLALRKHDADIRTDREIMNRINYLYREAKNDIATGSIKKVDEGYTLKKITLDKYVSPGNADDYAPDLKVKNTSYEIVHNKTGKVVGHAELKSDDYFGHGNLWIRMNNGAERYVDLKGMDPQAAINKFIKNPKTSAKYTQIAETSKDPILSKWRNSVVRRIKRASPEDQKTLNARLQKAKTASDFEQIHITLDKLGVRDELTQIDESKSYFTVQSLVQKFYEENNIDSRSQYLEIKHPGMRVWTRGDGRRYREPGVIRDDSEGKDGGKQLQAFWKWLVKLPGVKHLGKVSGEFGSSPSDDAYVYGGLYFSLSTYGIIKWGSKSRLRNSSIWRKTAEQQESVSENSEDLELYGLHVGDTVRANINGKRVQGSIIDIFPQSMEIELLLSGPNAGKTVTVDVRQTENLGEEK